MKLHGKTIDAPNEQIIPILRQTGNIIFKCGAVLSYDDFDNLCPRPEPPTISKPGLPDQLDTTDKDFLEGINEWASRRTDWMVVQSIKATDGFEWDTIVENDPTTWANWKDELTEAKFTEVEISRIFDGVTIACGLNSAKIEEATAAFLATLEAGPSEQS